MIRQGKGFAEINPILGTLDITGFSNRFHIDWLTESENVHYINVITEAN